MLRRVDSVIHVLGLKDVQYSIIGDHQKRGISGGQRKRVNIGIELVLPQEKLMGGVEVTTEREGEI